MTGLFVRATDLVAWGAGIVFNGHISQAAAICVRGKKSNREVLMITRRGGGKWGVPKGTVEPGETAAMAAAREAFEEAGVEGAIGAELGNYEYTKAGRIWPFRVTVYILEVSKVLDDFPEKSERARKWLPLVEAAKDAHQPEIRDMLRVIAARQDKRT